MLPPYIGKKFDIHSRVEFHITLINVVAAQIADIMIHLYEMITEKSDTFLDASKTLFPDLCWRW